MMVLVGDIGGTKTLLQIVQLDQNAQVSHAQRTVIAEQRFESQAYDQFDLLLQQFLEQHGPLVRQIKSACFGVAGPIKDGIARITNLPWIIDTAQLELSNNIERITLINDFQAIGYGIEGLADTDVVTLQQGNAVRHGVRAVLGAGTGLGEGFLVWQGDHYDAYPSEGGHVDFGPVNIEQIELLRYWQAKSRALSYEQLVSGPGLCNIFEFMAHHCETHYQQTVTPQLLSAMREDDAAAAIALHAMNNSDIVASKALEMFVQIYGAQAGNLALTTMAQGGVYIAGGIAAKILSKMTDGVFLQSFSRKDKMKHLMPGFPVHIIINPNVGLIGAVLVAARP